MRFKAEHKKAFNLAGEVTFEDGRFELNLNGKYDDIPGVVYVLTRYDSILYIGKADRTIKQRQLGNVRFLNMDPDNPRAIERRKRWRETLKGKGYKIWVAHPKLHIKELGLDIQAHAAWELSLIRHYKPILNTTGKIRRE